MKSCTGFTYLDENLTSSMSSFYVGIVFTMATIGPAAGYVLGGFFLSIYTELNE